MRLASGRLGWARENHAINETGEKTASALQGAVAFGGATVATQRAIRRGLRWAALFSPLRFMPTRPVNNTLARTQ